MADATSLKIAEILKQCDEDEKKALFKALRATNQIHALEIIFGAPAEVILEAIHRAPELTRRMLRGVIADAAFAKFTVPMLAAQGWRNVTPEGNFAFDHLLEDNTGRVSVQVKLQRSERGNPVITTGRNYGMGPGMYMVEPQKTRGGTKRGGDGEEASKTRPYRFGDFDVLAVSLQPSCGNWNSFRYTVGNWLLPGKGINEIATYQPVALSPNDDWTDDFSEVAGWLRSNKKKTIANKPKDLLG